MADYREISDEEIASGQPVKVETGRALRDNPLAISSGESGAPRIKDAALDTGASTAAGRTWVGKRIAGLSAGAVGSLAMAMTTESGVVFGDTVGGSALTPCNVNGSSGTSTLSGTWRCLGHTQSTGSSETVVTLWVRVS